MWPIHRENGVQHVMGRNFVYGLIYHDDRTVKSKNNFLKPKNIFQKI